MTAPAPAGVRTLTYREALREGTSDALSRDHRVFLMGEDVGPLRGLLRCQHGPVGGVWRRAHPTRPVGVSVRGAGIGAALGGMRPIVEIMTVNFSLLALDQHEQRSDAAAHVRRSAQRAAGDPNDHRGRRQLAAQHSHSLEGWYAHIPGIRIVTPATWPMRGMLWTALQDPDPVLIFEHGALYNVSGELTADAGPVDIERAAIRRSGEDVTLITYGGHCPRRWKRRSNWRRIALRQR